MREAVIFRYGEWSFCLENGRLHKAPLGKDAIGSNPIDRGKQGAKCSILTDGAGIL